MGSFRAVALVVCMRRSEISMLASRAEIKLYELSLPDFASDNLAKCKRISWSE
jgi:hypothetical protein